MARHIRSLVRLLFALSCGLAARGAWDDRFLGEPLIESLAPEVLGNHGALWCMAQHPRSGTLYVGSEWSILSHDGQRWESFPQPEVPAVLCLSFRPDADRVWVSGTSFLGYFDPAPGQPIRFVSLNDKVPFPVERLDNVWGCHANDRTVDFVAKHHVLRWDGTRFQTWEFPTALRLFPIVFEGALWFHHVESGLYRLEADGPKLVCGPAELPTRGLFWLNRQDGVLTGASNFGLQTLTNPSRTLSKPELNQLTQQNLLDGVSVLPRGFQAWATLGGAVAIVSPAGEIVRRIDASSGLTGRVMGQYLDRDGSLWILDQSHLARVTASGATAWVQLPGETRTTIESLRVAPDNAVWICTNQQVFRARSRPSVTAPLSVEKLPLSKLVYHAVLPTPVGLLLGHFGGISLFPGDSASTTQLVSSYPSVSIRDIRPSRLGDGRYLLLKSNGLAELTPHPDGTWTTREHTFTSGITNGFAEDSAGNVWLTNLTSSPSLLRYRDQKLQAPARVLDQSPARFDGALLFERTDDTVIVANRLIHLIAAGSDRPRALPLTLPETPRSGTLSADGRRLYLVFQRTDAPEGYKVGVGRVDISDDSRQASWHDLNIPDLRTIGQITTLAVAQEKGSDTLWIGGSEGLMQARVAEIQDWMPPRPLGITVSTEGSPSVPRSTFPWRQKIAFHLRSDEIAARSALRFQTKLGDDKTPWGAISPTATFEFPNLGEGTYTFAARAVNPAGQASEPAYFTFTILPPWYRSPWAYAGYSALILAAGIVATRIRERRIRARNLQLERLVQERTAELEKANAAKDDFLASMSHEIRNPMNGVVGLSAAIDISPLDAEGRYRFGLLRHCASHLASLLEDILDFSKLQAGTIELDPQPFAPAELIDAVSAITSPVSAAAGVKVEFALGPTVPPRLLGDARRIRQVLLNYVSNAVKYAPQGTIDVTAWARPVSPGRITLTFAVSDEGPGIPAAEQARIFEKFERGAGARSSRIPGTGMGLAVCRRLAEKMGGRAWVESTPGDGATFYLELDLPVARVDSPLPLATALDALPKRALVVDDEEYNLIALSALLERRGFQVQRAANATTALHHVAAHKPDVVFLDYDMPDTTGPRLAQQIRETNPANHRQPLIIATTAYTTVEKREECMAAGMDGFLGKPVTEEHLRAALDEAILHRAPGSTRHLAAPAVEPGDPLENLQVLARQHARALEAEIAEFARDAAEEFAELHHTIATTQGASAARSAHKLSGRFGFLHAPGPAQRALRLEEACRYEDWETAQRLAAELAQDWATLQTALSRLTCESAG